MSGYQLAQINIARAKAPLDSELLRDFVDALDAVNAMADDSPGFVWRLKTEDGNATSVRAYEDERIIVNMSVWESIESLREFVYRGPAHLAVLRRRREWFELMDVYMALWWVAAGHVPTVAEAQERLDCLATHGPTPLAFTFRVSFPPPNTTGADEAVRDQRWLCPA